MATNFKQDNPGCDCCCGPVTEHVDEFTSFWSCFLGRPNGYAVTSPAHSTDYQPVNFMGVGWSVSGGQLIYSRNAGATSSDPIIVDAVRLPVPYSCEFILEIAELNVVSGDQAVLHLQMLDGTNGSTYTYSLLGVGLVGTITPGATIVTNGTSQSLLYDNILTSLPATVWHKIQVDTDGITQWLWIDGVKPTAGIPGNTWGTKKSGTPSASTGNRKRYWALQVLPTPSGARSNWAKFNRMEVREWDHTVVTMPDPDNP